MTSTVISQVSMQQEKPIDREKVCPLLLRIFCANQRHHQLMEYGRGNTPVNELQVYTWLDCSLRELTGLIKEVNPDARRRGTNFDFSVVSPDRHGPRYSMREIGSTQNGQRGVDDGKTLAACKFEIGDFVDVAITMPRDGMGMGGPRRNFGDRPYGGGDRSFGGGDRSFGGGDRFGGGRNGGGDFPRRDMSPRRNF